MRLQVGASIIKSPLISILTKLQAETGRPRDIKEQQSNILITCPFHKDGKEDKPSCSILAEEDQELEMGTFQCWSCKESGRLPKIIAKCKNCSTQEAENWLLYNFPNSTTDEIFIKDKIVLEKNNKECVNLSKFEPLSEHALNYLIEKRKLKPEIIEKFGLLYDREHDAVVFPVKDFNGNVITTTQRSISQKFFYNLKESEKPVYLLEMAKFFKTVYVCESQINALTLWGYGKPAVALLGTGSDAQYAILNRSGIRNYILCFDGDNAGKQGDLRFRHNVKGLIMSCILPKGKDVNDLTEEEFNNLKCV